MKTNKLLQAAVAGALMAGALGSAQALDFNFTAGGGFIEGTAVGYPLPNYTGFRTGLDALNTPTGNGDDVWSSFSWGTPSNPSNFQSGAVINYNPLPVINPANPATATGMDLTGTLTVGGPQKDFGYLAHINNVISESWTVGKPVNISYNMWLDDGGAAGNVYKWNGVFQLLFTETPNSAPCPPPNPIGSVCDDIFSYTLVSGDPTTFSYGGRLYNIDISGFYDDPVEVGGTLQGTFYSGEGTDTEGWVRVSIAQVPEPASLALMGLGLAGLGFMRRRKSAQV